AYQKSSSVSEFLNEIKVSGHEPYYRGEKLQGIKYEGVEKHRFTSLGFNLDSISELDLIQEKQNKHLDEIRNIKSDSQEKEQNNRLEEFEKVFSSIQLNDQEQVEEPNDEDNSEDESTRSNELNNEFDELENY